MNLHDTGEKYNYTDKSTLHIGYDVNQAKEQHAAYY